MYGFEIVTPAPSSEAMTAGMTRTSAKVPAPLLPSVLATTQAEAAAAAAETKLAATVSETLRTSFTGSGLFRSRRAGPADERLARIALGPRLVECAVQVVRRADHEFFGAADRLERLLHRRLAELFHGQ